jgi:DNA polymerase
MPTTHHTSAADFVPARMTLPALVRAADECRGCDLYKNATQTVFGRGPRDARLMLLGEMPGDEEDRTGEPFVGPAGRLLHDCLDEASIDRDDVYVTNAVKHFRWEPRGKRRLHKKPSARQIEACKPWLHAEILVVKPKIVACLGATTAQSLMGRNFRVTKQRGQFLETDGGQLITATYHPSAILRVPDASMRERMRGEFVDDLRAASQRLRRLSKRR